MQMTALCRELKLNLGVAYLNGRRADSVDFAQFRGGFESQKPLTPLYRCVLITPLNLNFLFTELSLTDI